MALIFLPFCLFAQHKCNELLSDSAKIIQMSDHSYAIYLYTQDYQSGELGWGNCKPHALYPKTRYFLSNSVAAMNNGKRKRPDLFPHEPEERLVEAMQRRMNPKYKSETDQQEPMPEYAETYYRFVDSCEAKRVYWKWKEGMDDFYRREAIVDPKYDSIGDWMRKVDYYQNKIDSIRQTFPR